MSSLALKPSYGYSPEPVCHFLRTPTIYFKKYRSSFLHQSTGCRAGIFSSVIDCHVLHCQCV